jgi:hypothetical protein
MNIGDNAAYELELARTGLRTVANSRHCYRGDRPDTVMFITSFY